MHYVLLSLKKANLLFCWCDSDMHMVYNQSLWLVKTRDKFKQPKQIKRELNVRPKWVKFN